MGEGWARRAIERQNGRPPARSSVLVLRDEEGRIEFSIAIA